MLEVLQAAGYKDAKAAYSVGMAKEVLASEKFELVLLDIRMDEEDSGLQLAQVINESYGLPFIFVTANDDATTLDQALSVSPKSYLSKPFTELDLIASVRIALSNSFPERNGPYLLLKDGYKKVKIYEEEILYIQSDGNYARIVTPHRKYLLRYSLEWFMNNLSSNTFIRTHRTAIVHKEKVVELSSKTLRVGDEILPISKTYHAQVHEALK